MNHEGEMTATTVGKEKIRILSECGIVVYQKKKKDNPTQTVRFNNINTATFNLTNTTRDF